MNRDKLKSIIGKKIKSLLSENITEAIIELIYEELENELNFDSYVLFLRLYRSNKVNIVATHNLKYFLRTLNRVNKPIMTLDGFIYFGDKDCSIDLLTPEENNKMISPSWYSLTKEESKSILERNNGKYLSYQIDENLIIENGVAINYKPEPESYLDNNPIINTIEKFMKDNSIKKLQVSAKDIQMFIIQDEQVELTDIRRQIKRRNIGTTIKRYYCQFLNISKTGRVYTFSTD
jgi:hypothetical protein